MIVRIPCKYCQEAFKSRLGIKRHLKLYHQHFKNSKQTLAKDMNDCMNNMTFREKKKFEL